MESKVGVRERWERGGEGGGNGVREGVTESIFIVHVLSIYKFSYNPWFPKNLRKQPENIHSFGSW